MTEKGACLDLTKFMKCLSKRTDDLHMFCSKYLPQDVVSQMLSSEAALCASQNPSFHMAATQMTEDLWTSAVRLDRVTTIHSNLPRAQPWAVYRARDSSSQNLLHQWWYDHLRGEVSYQKFGHKQGVPDGCRDPGRPITEFFNKAQGWHLISHL